MTEAAVKRSVRSSEELEALSDLLNENVSPQQVLKHVLKWAVELIPAVGSLLSNLIFGVVAEVVEERRRRVLTQKLEELLQQQSATHQTLAELLQKLARHPDFRFVAVPLEQLGQGQLPRETTSPVLLGVERWRRETFAEDFKAQRVRVRCEQNRVLVTIAVAADVRKIPLLRAMRERLDLTGAAEWVAKVIPAEILDVLGLPPADCYWRSFAKELFLELPGQEPAALSYHPRYAFQPLAPGADGFARFSIDFTAPEPGTPPACVALAPVVIGPDGSVIRISVRVPDAGAGEREVLRFTVKQSGAVT